LSIVIIELIKEGAIVFNEEEETASATLGKGGKETWGKGALDTKEPQKASKTTVAATTT